MFKTLKQKLNKKGFTLAELLVVVAIIAILVAIAIPIFTHSTEQAEIAVKNANLRAVRAAAVEEILTNWADYKMANYTDDATNWQITAKVSASGDITDLGIQPDGTPSASPADGTAEKQSDGSYYISGMILTQITPTKGTVSKS